MLKKDFFLAGILIGAIMPLLVAMATTFVNIYFLNNPDFDIIKSGPALMMGLIPNVILFRIFMVNLKKYQMGKGILLATLVFVFLILMKH